MNNYKYDFGDKLKNVTTGEEGIVNARLEYATGCRQYNLIDGKKDHYYDEGQLILLEAQVLKRKSKMVERYDIISTKPINKLFKDE